MTGGRRGAMVVAASAAVATALAGSIHMVIEDHSAPATLASTAASHSAPIVERPLSNDCSSGHVTFTFDDGPGRNTEKVLDALDRFGIDAVFFWNGQNVEGREHTVTRALREGHAIGNHAWNHADMTTGDLPDGSKEPWSAEWVRSELERTNAALMAAGAPRPKLYRPPYGAINREVDSVAQELGLSLVMPWGYHEDDNIVDTHDAAGANAHEIAEVTTRWVQDDSIITMHGGEGHATLDALQTIVDAMNEKGLCATTEVREDASGRVLEMYG